MIGNSNASDLDHDNFGDLLRAHLLRGTRPGGNLEKPGVEWGVKEFADRVGVTDRTVQNWFKNKHPPSNTTAIARVLFGTTGCYDPWRTQLRRVHAKTKGLLSSDTANKTTPPATVDQQLTAPDIKDQTSQDERPLVDAQSADARHAAKQQTPSSRPPLHAAAPAHAPPDSNIPSGSPAMVSVASQIQQLTGKTHDTLTASRETSTGAFGQVHRQGRNPMRIGDFAIKAIYAIIGAVIGLMVQFGVIATIYWISGRSLLSNAGNLGAHAVPIIIVALGAITGLALASWNQRGKNATSSEL